jgi:malate dehydrogenase (oxaloacetate-decarboxylating)(NADP+)
MARKDDALDYHRRGRKGKLEVVPTKPLVSQNDLSLAYTPGVAEPCLAIAADEQASWDYTARGNLVAVISNGTAVLGLGNIGAAAGKPVMEGKACLFKKFADIDVFDLEVSETDVDKFVELVAALEPTFGGINLEDIAAPACFEIEEKLRARMKIPVFHDDQHGTAIISGAGLINAARLAEKDLATLKVVVSGAGAGAIACVEFFVLLGVTRANVILVDSKGVVHAGRTDLNAHKRRFAIPDDGRRTLADAMVGADMFMGLSVAGVCTPAMVKTMGPIARGLRARQPRSRDQTTPTAIATRPDAIVATGRSDFPNQVNNVLGFPYIFRGALDVRATHGQRGDEARRRARAHRRPHPRAEVPDRGVRRPTAASRSSSDPSIIIPKPFDDRASCWWVAPAIAKAAMDVRRGARDTLDLAAYRERLMTKSSNAAYSIMRGIARTARRDPRRIVFPDASHPRVLRAAQRIVEEGIARPILLGRPAEVRQMITELDLTALGDVPIIDPRAPGDDALARYAARMVELRQRKGMTLPMAQSLVTKRNYFGVMMVEAGDADGIVTGLRLNYPETVRPALQIFGLAPGAKVAVGMYMMVLQNAVKFFGDTVFTPFSDSETLADIAVQMADAVASLGIPPRVAMINYSNFGSVSHPDVSRVQRALDAGATERPNRPSGCSARRRRRPTAPRSTTRAPCGSKPIPELRPRTAPSSRRSRGRPRFVMRRRASARSRWDAERRRRPWSARTTGRGGIAPKLPGWTRPAALHGRRVRLRRGARRRLVPRPPVLLLRVRRGALPEHSPLVMLLHSILGTGTNTFAMPAEQDPQAAPLLERRSTGSTPRRSRRSCACSTTCRCAPSCATTCTASTR